MGIGKDWSCLKGSYDLIRVQRRSYNHPLKLPVEMSSKTNRPPERKSCPLYLVHIKSDKAKRPVFYGDFHATNPTHLIREQMRTQRRQEHADQPRNPSGAINKLRKGEIPLTEYSHSRWQSDGSHANNTHSLREVEDRIRVSPCVTPTSVLSYLYSLPKEPL